MLRAVFAGMCAVIASGAAVMAADLGISSPAFADKGPLAAKYSCDGEGVSPPLCSATSRPRTASLALIVEDPDIPEQFKSQVPGGVFDHWVIWDIARRQQGIRGGCGQGRHQRGRPARASYPACPPDKAHRYFFKLFALDTKLTGATTSAAKLICRPPWPGTSCNRRR